MTDNNSNPEDTGQISVAELLARNGQKSSTPSSGGRRRRGVKGGISVAELTGEIPIVRAEPASDAAPVNATTDPTKSQAEAVESQAGAGKSQPEAGKSQPEAVKSQPEAGTPAPTKAPGKPSSSTGTTQRSEPELLSGSTTAAGDLLNQSHDETERRASAQADQRISKRPVPSKRPQRTSGFVPRPRAPRPEVEDDPKGSGVAGTDDAVTQVTPTVGNGGLSKGAASEKSTQQDASSKDASSTDASSKGAAGTDTAVEKPGAPVSIVKADKAEIGQAAGKDDATAAPVEDVPNRNSTSKKDAVKQWLALIGQGLVAIVVGALLFKGFERLWDVLPWVALILAVLVIVGLVAVVRILRRTDDMVSMVIAIVVGVFVTLGPLAFQLSTG